ncbi:adrenocortical dysplasia protein homolog [Rhynchocyon petersi]
MAGLGSLALRPWIREVVLGPEELSVPRAVQLLEVLQEAEIPGPSCSTDESYVGAALLVSDGTHSIRCLLTGKALDTSDWEKEFGFRGTESRLLLLHDCGVRVQVAERDAPSEFYLQVDRFSLLPMEQPRVWVANCNQDRDVQKKLCECLMEHLSEPTSPNPGLTLTQLLDEVQEDQDHRGSLVRLAESCLMLAGPGTTPPLTRWATLRCKATGEAVYSVPSSWLHISEKDQQILSSLSQGPELPPPDPALQDLSLTRFSSSTSSTEFKKQGLPLVNQQPPARTNTGKEALDHSPVWTLYPFQDPPKRHRDGSAFQYEYPPPCPSLCAQVQAVRLPPELVAWALHFLTEPPPESELTQV